MNYLMHVVSGRRQGVFASLVRIVLSALSLLYLAGSKLHRFLYRLGILRSVKLPVPVISVGNLTAGGTGKTPMVEFLARWFSERNLKVAILSRGYGRFPGGDDESLGAEINNVRRFTGANRARLARHVLRSFTPDIIILDDGFQHYRIRRDLDIVLIDALSPFSNGRLLPRGLLREPPSGCRRADLLVLTRSDQVEPVRLQTLRDKLTHLSGAKPLVEAAHRPVQIRILGSNRKVPIDWVRSRELLAFCGIGNPEAFKATLEMMGANLVNFVAFPDHYRYRPEDARHLELRAKEFLAEALITTTKDAAKLRAEDFESQVLVLSVEFKIVRGEDVLTSKLQSLVGTRLPVRERSLTSIE